MFLFFLFAGGEKIGELDGDYGGEDEGTARDLPRGEHIRKNDPTADGGKDTFETHCERSDGRGGIPLPDYLQGISHRAGHNTKIQNGEKGFFDALYGKAAGLENERQGKGNSGADGKLNKGEADTADLFAVAIDKQNLKRKGTSAEENEDIPQIDAAQSLG